MAVQALAAQLRDNVRVANGYHHDITTVKLNKRHGIEDRIPEAGAPVGPPRPYAILAMGQEAGLEFPEKGMVHLLMPFDCILVDDVDESDDEAELRAYYRLCADIETALAKQTLGGLVEQITIRSRELSESESATIRVLLHCEMLTRRFWGSPNA